MDRSLPHWVAFWAVGESFSSCDQGAMLSIEQDIGRLSSTTLTR